MVALVIFTLGALVLAASFTPPADYFSPPVARLFSAMVIALANNVDNLGARLAYSIQGTRVGLAINAWISTITLFISAAAAYLGEAAALLLGKFPASLFAAATLVALGLWMILHARPPSRRKETKATRRIHILTNPHDADIDGSRHIDFAEGTLLGLALSINNVGGGVTAGVLGLDPILVGVLSAAVSFVALFAGNYVARFFIERRIAGKAGFVGGVALILIGLKQLV